MAETVKKSRIVSDSDDNLEESLMEEFNIRLKNCMSQDDLQEVNEEKDDNYENVEVIKSNGQLKIDVKNPTGNPSYDFIQIERENYYEVPKCKKLNGHDHDTSIIKKTETNENHYETVTHQTKTDFIENINVIVEDQKTIENNEYETIDEPSKKMSIPNLTFQIPTELSTTNETIDSNKSVKDRMFLSTDDTSCLLFTQTVTSPMLTPSEENIDFLKGFRRQSTQNTSSENSNHTEEKIEDLNQPVEDTTENDGINLTPPIEEELNNPQNSNEIIKNGDDEEIPSKIEENIYENSEFLIRPAETLYENFEVVKEASKNFDDDDMMIQEDIYETVEAVKNHINEIEQKDEIDEVSPSQLVETIKQQLLKSPMNENKNEIKETNELRELKTINIMKQISRFEGIDKDASNVCVSSQISESTYVETSTVVETKSSGEEKSLKKKKSKKSRSHEKENISVSETNSSSEESFYNVNVKNLCRSFGDLTKIGDEKCNTQKPVKTRTKSMCDVRTLEINKNIENVFGGVSVKALKSSFSKFDALQKKNVLHVRSSDSTKAQEKFNGTQQDNSNCKSCSKPVFQMEQIKAEKAIWHKNCFRCQECNKQLNVDTYQSNEGTLYCKPHFKALFTPKAVEDETPTKPKKHELIIRENQPRELPPDVVRASDKPDLGLEELQSLNVKERFQVFEQHETETNQLERTPSAVNVKRSPSILSKLARFQAKGMDIGVADDSLNGIPIEESSSEEEVEEEEELEGEDADLIRAKRAQKEKPFHFVGMSDVKSKWEQGDHQYKDERREERKQEIQSIRNRLFMGKQGKMKEAYQQAVMESESGANVKKASPIDVCDTTRSLKERFEKGEVFGDENNKEKEQEDMEVFESAISKKSRSIFLELDANASKAPQISPVTPPKQTEVKKTKEVFLQHQTSEDVVKSSEQIDDVTVRTADIQQRFKFFETYKEPEKQRKEFRITPPRDGQVKAQTPEREVYRDPEVVRAEEYIEDSVIAKETHTATKMLNKFRQMEENMTKEQVPAGPKPLKRFTPPPEPAHQEASSEEESGSEEESEENDEVDNTKYQDDDLIEAQKAARAKQLRAKFERWEANEIRREQNNSSVNIAEELGEESSQVESTKSLRARFESMKENKNDSGRTPRIKVNRFVEIQNCTDICQGCGSRVYPLEKISVHGHMYHKSCFRCMECSAILRMDSYSYNQGLLYCMPHFKRLFISKGNYDTAFGLGPHKEKWNTSVA